MKVNKLDHNKGKSLVWMLAQMRAMLEGITRKNIHYHEFEVRTRYAGSFLRNDKSN